MIGIELTPEHPVSRIAELGEHAEANGFDTVFSSCHYNNRDPFVALDRIAKRTEDVRLGPGIANPYETHPVTLASRVASLDEASGGRAVYGIGPGDRSTIENLGFEHDSALRRVLEAFKIAQRLFDGERVDHDGTFEAVDAGLNFEIRSESIPVYVGAQGPHMIRMSAKHADGLLLNGSHPKDIAWAAEQAEKGLADRPEERGEFDFAAYASVSLSADAEAAREAARPAVAFITAGAAPPVLDRHDIARELASAIGEHISAGKFESAFEAVTEGMIDAFCIAGTPEEVEGRIDAVLEHADSFVAGSPLGPDLDEAVRLAGSALRSRTDPA